MKHVLLFTTIYLFLACASFAQKSAERQVYYDNWPTKVKSNAPSQPESIGVVPSYVPIGTTWDHRIITYSFANGTADITGNDERQAIRDGFALWAAQTDLYFLEVCANAGIEFSWGTFNHGDTGPFDGTDGTLAHTLGGPPPNVFGAQAGDVHFDDSEDWTLATRPNNVQPIDLVTVAAHEIGHALGLNETSVAGSLMIGSYSGSHRYLAPDDAAGIRFLYGDPTANIPIIGPSLVCTTGAFSVVGAPAGTTISWSSDNANLSINSGGSDNEYYVKYQKRERILLNAYNYFFLLTSPTMLIMQTQIRDRRSFPVARMF